MTAIAKQTKEPVDLTRRRMIPLRHPGARGGSIHAGFDSARTTANNRRHWAAADGLSADAAATPEVRRTLRNRARYEVANNSYARGIVLTLANETVGTGPRLQMLTGDETLNREIEREFSRWSAAVGLPEKLRTTRMARCQDGEAFGILVNNPRVAHEVRLDLRLVEAEQVASPFSAFPDPMEVDGIRLDSFGNPVLYRVLRSHPGDSAWSHGDSAVEIPASAMIHIFRSDRPGQHGGIPEVTPALPLFAQLRRFTLAVLSAAEAAADFAGILYTDAPAGGEAENVEPMDMIELERNMLLTMPGGWKMGQIEPRQPATTYAEFKREILNEIARCLGLPYNIAAGNSSGFNYASGRLDHQSFYKSIRVDQAFMAERILDPLLDTWLWEYALVHGFHSEFFPRAESRQHATGAADVPTRAWFWDGMEHVDPAKEATAQNTRLENNTTTLASEYARQGKDWETELRQRAREKKLMTELGLAAADATVPDAPQAKEEVDDG